MADSQTNQNDKNRRRRLAKLEKRIERGLKSELVVAYAIRLVHREGLFELDYDNFESYAQRRWGFSKTYAHYLIRWADLHEAMEARGHNRLPETESAARPLTTLKDPTAEDAVWTAILERRSDGDDRPITRDEVATEVRLYNEVAASILTEDGEALNDSAVIVLPGPSPLVGAYGRVIGDPPEVEKGQGKKSERPLVRVPGTLFESPTRKLHLVEADRLPFEMTADSIGAMAAECERLGLRSIFNTTNASVDWARFTWGVLTGCGHGCPFCYARPMSQRYFDQGFTPTFNVDRLVAPALTPVPDGVPEGAWERRVFVASMGDIMSKAFPDAVVQSVIDSMAAAPQWTFLVLTKLPARLLDFEWPPNVWVGASVVRPADAARTERVMARVTATVRWVSLEPLLGPVQFEDPSVFDWFVIGAQTRTWNVPDLQPRPEWVHDLIVQAAAHGVRVFMKENLRFLLRQSPTG